MNATRLTAFALASAVAAHVDGGAAHAQSAGVEALLEQARYWDERGQHFRAKETYQKVLQIDPQNALAQQALSFETASAVVTAPSFQPVSSTRPSSEPEPRSKPSAPTPKAVRDPAGDARAAGFRELDAGDLDGARRHFETALKLAPNDSDALGGLGLVQLRKQEFEAARTSLEKAARLGSAARWAEALSSATFYADVDAARALVDDGKYSQALVVAERLTDSESGDPVIAYSLLSDVLEQLGRYGEASRAARAALNHADIDPDFAEQLNMNALRLEALQAVRDERHLVAETLFKQGLVSYPDDSWIRYEYARYLSDQGRNWEARSLLEKLVQSGNPEQVFAAALLAEKMGLLDEASRQIARIPASVQTDEMRTFAAGLSAGIALNRARELKANGQGSQAIPSLKQIAGSSQVPNYRKADIAGLLWELGDTEAALSIAHSLLETGLPDAGSYDPVVRILAKAGETNFAYLAIQQAESQAKGVAEEMAIVSRLKQTVAITEADRLRVAGQYAQSYEILQSAWAQAPGDIDVLLSLARLYQAGDMTIPATKTFQMVLQKDPDNLDALMAVIDTAAIAGDFDLARTAFDRALGLDAENYEIYLAGARLEEMAGRDRIAKRYLERAREIYAANQTVDTGGFSAGNPFAARAAMPVSAVGGMPNPFDPAALMKSPSHGLTLVSGQEPRFSRASAVSQGSTTPFSLVSASAGPMPVETDPVLAEIAGKLSALDADTGSRIDVSTGYRDRSGESGLSALGELSGTAEYSTDFADGRIFARAQAVALDAGVPSESSEFKFGRNGLLQARALVAETDPVLADIDSQHEAGVALSAGYRGDLVSADIGSTPVGFERVQVVGGVSVSPSLSQYAKGKAWFERRPVTDSLLSYAGTRDPVTGGYWGAVMKTSGGLSVSYDKEGTGVYVEGAYSDYDGVNVLENSGLELNVGGYLLAMSRKSADLKVGINGNYQTFDNNQNLYTFGHGGYFSPQSFLSVSFPVRYQLSTEQFEASASVSPGYQSFEQDSVPFFPTDAAAQGELDALALLDSDVLAYHEGSSETGFGINLQGTTYFKIGPDTSIGGEVKLDTFGEYNEFVTMFGIRQKFGAR